MQKLSAAFLVAIIAFAVIFPALGIPEVYQVSEGREGVVVNAMLESGEYILPLRHAEIVPSKPPLFHWVNALLKPLALGDPEVALRLPSAVAAAALAILLFWNVSSLAGVAVGLLSGLIIVSTAGFVRLAADGRVDMLFCFFSTAAILRWLRSYWAALDVGNGPQGITPAAFRELAIWCGFAILAKGPLGIVLPVLVIAATLIFCDGPRSLSSLLRRQWVWLLAVSVPWYVLATIKGGSAFFGRQIIFENIDRFIGAEGISQKPIWFYLTAFWPHAAPWGFVLLALAVPAVREELRRRRIPETEPRFLPSESNRRWLLRVSTIWFVVPIVFLSLSSGKRSAYLLSIVPPLTIIVSLLLLQAVPSLNIFTPEREALRRRIYRFGLWALVVTFVAAVLIWFGVTTGAFRKFAGDSVKAAAALDVFDDVLQASQSFYILSFALLFVVCAGTWTFAFRRGSPRLAAVSVFAFIHVYLVVFMTAGQAVRGETHGYLAFAESVAAAVPGSEPIVFIKRRRDESFDGFFFYMNRTIRMFSPETKIDDSGTGTAPEVPGLYLARVGWIHEQPDRWTTRVEELLVGGRLVDTPEKKIMLFRLKPVEQLPSVIAEPPAVTNTDELDEE